MHLLTPYMRTPVPSSAVVPKCYGYYIPVDEEEEVKGKCELKLPWQKRSPILLMEECGTPIVAKKLSRYERYAFLFSSSSFHRGLRAFFRIKCFALIARLSFAEYVHLSVYERNIVVQPGPLTQPPIMRSMDTPSFRVIDFGRTIPWDVYLKTEFGLSSARFGRRNSDVPRADWGKDKEKDGQDKKEIERQVIQEALGSIRLQSVYEDTLDKELAWARKELFGPADVEAI